MEKRFEFIEPKMVLEAGSKVLDLAEAEHWSSGVLYMVLIELARFLERQGVENISVEDVINN